MSSIAILWLGVFLVLLLGLGLIKSKTGLSFSTRVFISMVLGIALGLGIYFTTDVEVAGGIRKWLSLVGYGYVDLLKMLILPLVPASIISGLLKLSDTSELKTMGVRTISLFLFTAVLASIIGIVIASILGVGSGVVVGELKPREASSVVDLFSQFRSFIPSNPVKSAVDMKIIPLVVFSIFIGVAAVIESGKNSIKIEPFKAFIDSFLVIVTRLTKLVIKLTPYGVLGLTSYWLSNSGLSAIRGLALFVVGIIIACLIQVFVVYGGLLVTTAKVNPIRFFRAASPAMLLAFTSRSSLGTLTLTVSTMIDRLKIKPRVANFVGPIGAVMNMDACGGIFPAVVSIFAANAFDIELSTLQYILIVVVSVFASVGSAAVPMGATAFTIVTLTTVGLPVEAVGLVSGVDFLVDMFRTATNVTGDLTASVVVGNSLGEFDREAFESQDFKDVKEA
ncbi:dicarboxylate/amino acid:cation symporter [Thiospirochaeta perfilievii]|uniref:Dicarboxylate/amino acid:cation symporter n=1 Tax=Thiospirochaeta perfilievii TaxID=252967 RepID=A0A5C1QDC4_9SPIO|nr:dicarboxylate/amino acid:cation symporter [Thiospirochaeta perfilievii]QEN05070.1 dicarboxylate/amino acid:cation symporter [Thiospirochaeta perfilievii]